MDWWEWLATVGGAGLVLLVLADVVLTVLQSDIEGPVARAAQRGTWAAFRAPARRLPRWRRSLLAAAGPAMMVATFGAWFSLFVLGFALVYWPVIDSAYAVGPSQLTPVGFMDALYYSGVTGTVLGYGDITPVRGVMKALGFLESGLGSALLTAIIAHLLSITGGLGERNTLGLRLRHERGVGDGADLVVDWMQHEGAGAVARRVDDLAEAVAVVQERVHRFPLVSMYYRSRHQAEDPEPALLRLTEIALAARALTHSEAGTTLLPAARRLSRALSDSVEVLAPQNVRRRLDDRAAGPGPGSPEQAMIESVVERLARGFPDLDRERALSDERALDLAAKMRAFLDGLDEITLWRLRDAA